MGAPHRRSSASPTVQESAQFSAMATELADQDTVGTALTLQMALGFSVTVVGIFSIPLVEVCMTTSVVFHVEFWYAHI